VTFFRLILTPAALVVACPEAAVAQKPRAELPTYEMGDQWFRSDGVFELIRIEANRYVFSAPGKEIHLTKDLAIARTSNGPNWVEISPPMRLSWPLEVGKWGVTQDAKWRSHNNPSGPDVRLSWEVKAYEDVKLGSKTLKAFKVEFAARAVPWTRSWTAWFAPEAQHWVRSEAPQQTMPLANFKIFDVAPAAALAVRIDEPADQGRVGTTTPLTAAITARRGVASVDVTLNGVEVFSGRPSDAPRSFAVGQTLTLKDGKNTLIVTVTDRAGDRQQEARTVFSDKPAVVAAPPATKPPPPAPTPEPAAKPAPPAQVAALPPPPPLVVRLSSPADKARVEHETVALAGVASGGKGVSRVTVTLNGVEVHKRDESSPACAVPLNLPLKLREGANTLVVTVAGADGALEQETRVVSYERPVPFGSAFRFPEDRARVTEETSLVAAIAQSSRGITQARILLNATEIHQQTERSPQRSLLVTAPLTLRDGPNLIVVAATQADGTVHQELRTVIFDRPKVAAAPPPPPAPKLPVHERWAVVIGVGTYESPTVPRLRYTVSDAEAIYQTLIGPAGFKKENVLLLTDRSERKPTLRNIKWALGTFLGRSAKKDDTVLIFFTGHGAPEVDTRGVERDGLAKYLIPSDADPDHPLPGQRPQGRRRSESRRPRHAPGALRVRRAAGHREVARRRRQPASRHEGRDGRRAAVDQGRQVTS